MSRQTFLYLTIGLLVILLVVTACQPSRRPVPTEEGAPPVATESAPQEIQETEPASGEAAPETQALPSGSEVPEDIPIPEAAYELQIARKGTYIQYKVDGEIADVVAFYEQEFPNSGWDQGRSPDTVVGAMASLLREKEIGDRVTISMQKNQLGGFVVVTISISREQ